MVISGVLALGLTIATSLLMPQLFGTRLGENVHEAQWVVFFLGTSLAIEIAFGAYSGVLTGCHRWGLVNIIESGWHVATIIGMIVALLMGNGLRILALIYLMGIVLAYATRVILAYHVCEGLQVRLSLVRWEHIRRVLYYAGKTLMPSVSNLLLNQTTSVLIVAYLGPAALAVYSRPRSLIHHAEVLIRRMSTTLPPTISSLESTGNVSEIRELVIQSTRYSLYLALPAVLMLVVFGGSIMRLWMGQRYANALVPAILAAGYLAVLVQLPSLHVLAGLNAHGRAGVARFVASLCSVGLNVLVLGYFRWGLSGTAVAVTLPLAIVNVVDIPLLLCWQVGLDVKKYFLSVLSGPAVHVLPFAICLVGARILFYDEPLIGLAWGGTVGGAVLVAFYWRYVFPKSICAKLRVKYFCSAG